MRFITWTTTAAAIITFTTTTATKAQKFLSRFVVLVREGIIWHGSFVSWNNVYIKKGIRKQVAKCGRVIYLFTLFNNIINCWHCCSLVAAATVTMLLTHSLCSDLALCCSISPFLEKHRQFVFCKKWRKVSYQCVLINKSSIWCVCVRSFVVQFIFQ